MGPAARRAMASALYVIVPVPTVFVPAGLEVRPVAGAMVAESVVAAPAVRPVGPGCWMRFCADHLLRAESPAAAAPLLDSVG